MRDFINEEALNTLNHSCAHVMAQAVKHLYPQAKFWVGPVVSEGFYYDIDLGDQVITDDDLPKIEKEMKKICKDGKRIIREDISKEEALDMFKDDPYKLDLIQGLEDGHITCYRQGDFVDLCRGPHVETVKLCKNFKLLKNLDIYLFESNHDIELLQHGPYPSWLKKRVLSDEGHLSNKLASFYLSKFIGSNTKKIILIHLSETNNLESIAMETINNAFLDKGISFNNIICARQNEATEVIEV